MADESTIPPEYAPDPNQIPAYVHTPDDLERFKWCFAITRLVAGRDDPVFCAELFNSDMPTSDLTASEPPAAAS